MTTSLYIAKNLEGQEEHVLLKTDDITLLRPIATRVHPDQLPVTVKRLFPYLLQV